MKVRDMYSMFDKNQVEHTMPSGGLEVIADDGRPLFCIIMIDGGIEISTSSFCKHGGKILDTSITMKPRSTNVIQLYRSEYITKGGE